MNHCYHTNAVRRAIFASVAYRHLLHKAKKSYFEIIVFYCNAQECSHCIPLLSHSIIPLHINGTNAISLPLLLFIIHVVGAHRNPSHGALILFVLAEQIHPKRQVAVLKKHFIYSLNRQYRQRVGEEITRWNGLSTGTLLTPDLLRTSGEPLSSPRIEIWSTGLLQRAKLPSLAPGVHSTFTTVTLARTLPWHSSCTTHRIPRAFALKPHREATRF